MQQIGNGDKHKKKSPSHKIWNFSIWNYLDQIMVHQCDLRWNQVEVSILLMYQKLKDLEEYC
jgi:hypothetical protein